MLLTIIYRLAYEFWEVNNLQVLDKADMDAEEAFLKSMKEKAEAEGALYGTGGANAKQTESTSSDEYDPAQAVPETFSSHAAPDFPNRISSPDVVKHNSPPQTQNRPSSAFANFAAATGLQDQAAGDDEDRSQSRSMSGSSSSASSVNIQTSELQPEKEGSPRELSQQRGAVNGTSSTQGVESIYTNPASIHIPTSTFDGVSPENVPLHNGVSLSSHAVQNNVSHPVPDVDSATLTSAGDAKQPESATQPASLPPNSKDAPVKLSVEGQVASPVSVVPRARLPHDIIGILDDRVKEDPRGDMDAWLSLIAEYRKRGKTEEARAAYERFFGVFPSAVSDSRGVQGSITKLST